MLLQQRLNALTGESEWMVVAPNTGGDGNAGDGASSALTFSLYLDMLNDRARNAAFAAAIAKLGHHHHPHVLDIGAGTGLLSMMALRAMKGRSRVTAAESFLPMFKLARRIFRENGVLGQIKLLHMRSDEINIGVDMPAKADALVCEILDSELIGEGVIPSLRHAHQHLLRANPVTIPSRATVYAQLVECDFLRRFHDLSGVESELQDGMTFASSELHSFSEHRQREFHVDAVPGIKLLSEPFEAFTLDFGKAPDACGQFKRTVQLNASGTAHAVVSWWMLQLDADGLINYSTAPRWIQGTTQWCDHWKQCVWFLPGQGVPVEQHSELQVTVTHDETSVQYHIGSGVHCRQMPGFRMSPERCRMLGDAARRSIICSSVEKALGRRSDMRNCLILDDGVVSAACALRSVRGSCRVAGLFAGYKRHGLKYVESIARNLTMISKDVKDLTKDDFQGHEVDALLAEPYYATSENGLPWQLLRFWCERTIASPLLSRNHIIVPCLGILYGMCCSLPDLWQSRCSLHEVEGFDHRSANSLLGACGNIPDGQDGPILPFSLWQCGRNESLTKPFPLLEFDMYQHVQSLTNSTQISFAKSGLCHGIVLWIDWVMDSENTNSSPVLSTGPLNPGSAYCWKQGVKLLRKPLQITGSMASSGDDRIRISASFDATSGEMGIQVFVDEV